jgi:hypothetical protein
MISLPSRASPASRFGYGRWQDFLPLGGTRSRLRAGILLTFFLVCLTLVFPFARHSRLFNGSVPKIQIQLEPEMADFQKLFVKEHDALGK